MLTKHEIGRINMQMQEHIESPSIKYPTKIDAWIVILIAAILLFVS